MDKPRLSAALIRQFKVRQAPQRFQLKQEAHAVVVSLVDLFAKDVAGRCQTMALSAGRVTFNLADVAAAVHAALTARNIMSDPVLARVLGTSPFDPIGESRNPHATFPVLFVKRGNTDQMYINHLSTMRTQVAGALLRTNRRALRVAEAVFLRSMDEYALEVLAAAGRAATWQQQRRIYPEHVRIGAEVASETPEAGTAQPLAQPRVRGAVISD
jgi:histone H3/H4